MGNGLGKLGHCLTGGSSAEVRRRQVCSSVTWEPCDESLDHYVCYVFPKHADKVNAFARAAAAADVTGETTFRANVSTPLSTSLLCDELTWPLAAAAFESSDSFSAVALQNVPHSPSGPLADRGFLSGPSSPVRSTTPSSSARSNS